MNQKMYVRAQCSYAAWCRVRSKSRMESPHDPDWENKKQILALAGVKRQNPSRQRGLGAGNNAS